MKAQRTTFVENTYIVNRLLGPVFALAQIQENMLEDLNWNMYSHLRKYVFAPLPPHSVWVHWLYSHISDANTENLGEFNSGANTGGTCIHTPGRMQGKTLGNLFMSVSVFSGSWIRLPKE